MSLAPTQQINFDGGGGIAAGQVVAVSGGITHLHKIKPGSNVTLDIKLTGLNVTLFDYAVEFRSGSVDGAVVIGSDDNTVTFTENPTGTDTERLRISISPTNSALLDGINGVWGLKLKRVSDSAIDSVVNGTFNTESRYVQTATFK